MKESYDRLTFITILDAYYIDFSVTEDLKKPFLAEFSLFLVIVTILGGS
jgi:hypothetical protein